MTDPMTPLTEESEALLAELRTMADSPDSWRGVSVEPLLARLGRDLPLIEAAAARRAIEGSGVVEVPTWLREMVQSIHAACSLSLDDPDEWLNALRDIKGWCAEALAALHFRAALPRDLVQGSGAPTNLPAPADRGGPEEPRAVGAVWCPCLLPGGWVCESCGQPVESEPCAEHMDPEGVMVYRPGVPCPDRARTPEAR